MSNVKVRSAFEQLRKYYGINYNNPYLQLRAPSAKELAESLSPNSEYNALGGFDVFSQPDEDNSIKKFMDRITTKSQTSPGVSSIFDYSKLNSTVTGIPMLITPYVGYDAASSIEQTPLVNTSIGKITRQGTRTPSNKKYYTFDDACGTPGSKISVIQIFSPVNSLAASDTDIAALYMNCVTSLEASRAVPYMDISIAAAVGVEQNSETTPMSLGRFLGLNYKNQAPIGSADYALANGVPVVTNFKETKINDNDGKTVEEVKLVTGIEIFTMPQTMVNADYAYKELMPTGKILDPFQPFMSVESMKLSVVGAGGLMSYRHGEISFILHDRSRMDEVASLIAPSKFGKTRLVITYGYSHPAGQQYVSTTSNEQIDNAVGVLMDSMKVTEVFQIINVSFSFSGQIVKLNMQISTVGSGEMSTMDIVYAEQGQDIKYVKEQLEIINRGIAESNQTTLAKKVVSPMFLANPNTIAGNGLNEEQLKALEELKKANYDGNYGAIIEELFGKNGKGGKVQTLIKNKNEQLDSLFKIITSTPDPFLPSVSIGDVNTSSYIWDGSIPPKSNTSTYVSLGKILSVFLSGIAKPSNTNFSADTDEVQLIFHPFNQDAGGMQDYNTAQFIIDFEEFKKVVKDRFDVTGSMSLKKFLELMRRFFLGDMGAIGYGLLDTKQRRMFKLDTEKGGRAAQEPKNSSKPNASKNKPKAYEEVLEESKKENLKILYGASPSASVTFRPPDIHFYVESVSKSKDWNDDPNNVRGTIIKIHVIDRACSTMSSVGEVLRSVSSSRIVPIEKRPTNTPSFPYASAHTIYTTKLMKELVKEKLLQPLKMDMFEKVVDDRKNTLKISKSVLDDLANNYMMFNGDFNRAKQIIKRVYPTLIYGSETSGLISANFSSENDSQLASIMLVRTGKEDDVRSNDRDGVPIMVMPASVSAETFGCPYFSYAQFFFLDLGTNTDVDNVYSITSIDHAIESGKFTTSLKMTHFGSYGVFRPLPNEMLETAIAAFLAKFNVKTPEKPKAKSPAKFVPKQESKAKEFFDDFQSRKIGSGIDYHLNRI